MVPLRDHYKLRSTYVKKNLDLIKTLLDSEFGFDIFKGGRKRQYVDARRIFVNIVYKEYDLKSKSRDGARLKVLTIIELAHYMGLSAHASVINLKKGFKQLCLWEPKYQKIYNRVLAKIQAVPTKKKIISLLEYKAELLAKIRATNMELELLGYEKKTKSKGNNKGAQ